MAEPQPIIKLAIKQAAIEHIKRVGADDKKGYLNCLDKTRAFWKILKIFIVLQNQAFQNIYICSSIRYS